MGKPKKHKRKHPGKKGNLFLLSPLPFEDAVKGLLATPPPPDKERKKKK